MANDFLSTPDDLPRPVDDGAADHLVGLHLPDIALPATTGPALSLAQQSGLLVLYIYPMTGQPGVALPDGWDDMPGARGCTPQSCALRDHYEVITSFGAEIIGLSTQSTAYQAEMSARLHLPYPVVSDANFQFADALRLPRFELHGVSYLKRLTMICKDGQILATHYPIFPSHADVDWLDSRLPQFASTTV